MHLLCYISFITYYYAIIYFVIFTPLYSVEFVIQFQFTYLVMTSLYLLVGVLAITSAYGELNHFIFLVTPENIINI